MYTIEFQKVWPGSCTLVDFLTLRHQILDFRLY